MTIKLKDNIIINKKGVAIELTDPENDQVWIEKTRIFNDNYRFWDSPVIWLAILLLKWKTTKRFPDIHLFSKAQEKKSEEPMVKWG